MARLTYRRQVGHVAPASLPHFGLPFRFEPSHTGLTAAVVDQDSHEEILTCVAAIMAYNTGERVEKPEFGVEDPAFSSPVLEEEGIIDAIGLWEPRAAIRIEQGYDSADDLITRALVLVSRGQVTSGV